MENEKLAQEISDAALACGLDKCGIIPLDDLSGFDIRIEERIEKVPSSDGFYRGFDRLADIRKRYPWGRSIVVCTFDFSRYRYPEELRGRYAKNFFLSPESGAESDYDLCKFEGILTDMGIRWEGGNHTGFGGPGPLRYEAMMAGLGITRKNNFFYTETGSYIHLFSWVIDRECILIHHPNIKPCSESCDLCRRACRTGPLKGPYTFDPGKCVSFLTTFGRLELPEEVTEDMLEEWLCGCDNCQDACPYNRRHDWDKGEPFSDLEKLAPDLTPEQILIQSDEFLISHVIAKTDNHLQSEDVSRLRRSAKRAIRFRTSGIQEK